MAMKAAEASPAPSPRTSRMKKKVARAHRPEKSGPMNTQIWMSRGFGGICGGVRVGGMGGWRGLQGLPG